MIAQTTAAPEAEPAAPDAAPASPEDASATAQTTSAPEAEAAPAPADEAADKNTTTIAAVPAPPRNPEKAAEPVEEADADTQAPRRELVDVPPPDINPNRVPPTFPPAPEPAMDYVAVLKPLLDYNISADDESRLRFVMRNKGTVDQTLAKISDPAVRAFAQWYRYKHNKSTVLDAEAIEKFRAAHPNWPGQDDLREKAETSLFLTDASPEEIKTFFGGSAPQTGAGKAALASVYLKEGNEAAAKDLIVSAWRDHRLNEDVEKKILAKFGNMLTAEHHEARIDMLLYPDEPSETAAALRVAKLLPEEEQKKVDARIAVIKRRNNAGKLLDALPDDAVEDDVGLRFNNIQWLRRTKDKEPEIARLEASARCADGAQRPARPQ